MTNQKLTSAMDNAKIEMEDTARLALVEQNIGDLDKFCKTLSSLLRHINRILEYPHDYEMRTIKSEILKEALAKQTFSDYLKSVGFCAVADDYTYPKELSLNNLRIAKAAIERKIYFCCGSAKLNQVKTKPSFNVVQVKKSKILPSKVLHTLNPFLLHLESLFNHVLKYENEELLEEARELIPVVTLQLMALDRMREHQRKLKAGVIKGQDMPFDTALLMELMIWFKYKFFTWVDKPPCEKCNSPTLGVGNVSRNIDSEQLNVELYKCIRCDGRAEFPRYNSPATLLRTRRGRCGEWANCFTLLCRALGYDARYVYDTTDHVWCEIFDFESNRWVHCDPCEAKLDAPLLYSHGWGKQLSYVLAVSRDDLQDVTWRYTTEHKQVLSYRSLCEESELIDAILLLRADRQRHVSEPRRRYLAKRCVQELVQMMVERKVTSQETGGRVSGAEAWRGARGELGRHVHTFDSPGRHAVKYCSSLDVYNVVTGGGGARAGTLERAGWRRGVWTARGVTRLVEHDWHMTYLAREEGSATGSISWKVSVGEGLKIASIAVHAVTTLYDSGQVLWTVTYDDNDPVTLPLGGSTSSVEVSCSCQSAVLSAWLSGGSGPVRHQHAQLARQHQHSKQHTITIVINAQEV